MFSHFRNCSVHCWNNFFYCFMVFWLRDHRDQFICCRCSRILSLFTAVATTTNHSPNETALVPQLDTVPDTELDIFLFNFSLFRSIFQIWIFFNCEVFFLLQFGSQHFVATTTSIPNANRADAVQNANISCAHLTGVYCLIVIEISDLLILMGFVCSYFRYPNSICSYTDWIDKRQMFVSSIRRWSSRVETALRKRWIELDHWKSRKINSKKGKKW